MPISASSLLPRMQSQKALVAGQALNAMEDRKLVRHGDWAEVYKQCNFGERQYADSLPALAFEPDIPASLGEMTVRYSSPRRRRWSRHDLAEKAITVLEACVSALNDKLIKQT